MGIAAIRPCELPADALLQRYRQPGAYTDCYVTEVAWPVSRSEYVEAFYTTGLFKVERQILRWLASRPSTDVQARQLASGSLVTFAAWVVEAQTTGQLLLRDYSGRTRSWLMVMPVEEDDQRQNTRLYFGSAVVPVAGSKTGQATLGFPFRSLLGFHKLYSRALLRAARSRLSEQHSAPR
jgi:hypothetical protein